MRARPRLAAAILALAPGCGKEPAAPAPADADGSSLAPGAFTMTDVTAASGIDFRTTSGRAPATQILEVKGAGLALLDYDDDGDLDLFVPNGATLDAPADGPGCRLFENVGGLRFRDVTSAAGLAFRRWGMGVAIGDYDNDGRDDAYVSCFGRDALLRNLGPDSQGRTRFAEVTDEAGIDVGGWSTGCAFGDLDADGDLDLYVARFIRFDPAAPPPPSTFRGIPVFAGPRGLPAEADVLLENLGDGTFRDVTAASGCGRPDPSYGLGVAILDLDGDGALDVFVGNDSRPNFLFRNRGDLTFDEVGVESGIAVAGDGSSRATMGIAVADVDDDGRPDVFTTNFAGEPNTLHLGRAGGFHDDASRQFGLGMVGLRSLGWACGFHDLDHDGHEDLFIVNGHVFPSANALTMLSDFEQAPLLLRRAGGRFARVTPEQSGPWLAEARCDRTAVFGDLDGDGDVDVITAGLNASVRVLRNDGARGHWLVVEPAPAPWGCRVEVTRAGATWRRWIVSGAGYLSASAPAAHFGLGADDAPVDIRVVWPDGTERTRAQSPVDRRVRVTR